MIKDDFSDLEDSKFWDRQSTGGKPDNLTEISAAKGAIYEEQCKKCHGGGRFISYAGRDCGPCFKCKGEGVRRYKTSPESRAHLKAKRTASKAIKAENQDAQVRAWLEANPERAAFLKQDWEFPVSLLAGLWKFGSLTENQIAAIDRSLEKQAARKTERENDDSNLDLTDLLSGRYAVPGGDTRLKLRVSRARKGTKWAGWIFVDDGAEYGQRQKYGSQRPGAMYNGKVIDELRTIMADPFEAFKAYGKLVGVCGVCGRHLEDAVSVAEGIGPICKAKFG